MTNGNIISLKKLLEFRKLIKCGSGHNPLSGNFCFGPNINFSVLKSQGYRLAKVETKHDSKSLCSGRLQQTTRVKVCDNAFSVIYLYSSKSNKSLPNGDTFAAWDLL